MSFSASIYTVCSFPSPRPSPSEGLKIRLNENADDPRSHARSDSVSQGEVESRHGRGWMTVAIHPRVATQ